MAERRMFSKPLMLSDPFTALSRIARELYICLNLLADDDGVCGNAYTVCRMCGCSKKYLQELLDGGWLLDFGGSVVVITHWHIHNQIRKNRYKPSIHTHVTARLQKTGNGIYVVAPDGCQLADQRPAQERIDKDRKEKDRLGKHRLDEESTEVAVSSSMPPAAAASDDIQIDYDKVLYNYQVIGVTQGLAPCPALTPQLRQLIQDRAREGYDVLRLLGVFQSAAFSPFLRGQTDSRGWKASLEWLLDPVHIRDVENGKYAAWH